MDRVYPEIVAIEKDLELIKQRGGGSLDEEIEECRRHTELIVDLCKDIQGAIHQDVRRVFATVGNQLTDELANIRRHELRINSSQQQHVAHLNTITTNKKGLAGELRQIIDTVKALDYDSKSLQNELSKVQNAYDEKLKDVTGTGQTAKIKEALGAIKVSNSNW